MSGSGLHVVLGASGGIGSAVVRALQAEGLEVRAVTRTGAAPGAAFDADGVSWFAADVATAAGAIAACQGASVVYHCAQPEYTRWAQEFPPLNEAVIAGAAAAGARLVFADNLYMYGPTDGPMTEATPLRATSRKGRVRIALAERLLAAHSAGQLEVVIGRASDYYGPGGLGSVVGDRFFEPAIAGKKVGLMGALDQPHTFSFLDDVGRALVLLGRADGATGRAWHLPAAEPLTQRQLVARLGAVLGRDLGIRRLPDPLVRVVGLFVPIVREMVEIGYQFRDPFVADASAFQRAFGPFPVTPHDEALAATVAWFRGRQHATGAATR